VNNDGGIAGRARRSALPLGLPRMTAKKGQGIAGRARRSALPLGLPRMTGNRTGFAELQIRG